MEENLNDIVCINNIKRNFVAADIVNNKKLHIKKSLSIPHSSFIYNNNNNQNTPAVNCFDHSAKALGMSKSVNRQSELLCYRMQTLGRRAITSD